jgi:hypothetical protein
MWNISASWKVVFIFVLITGCASFEPGLRLQELHRPRQPAARAVQEGMEVAVEDFYTPAKSKMMFDAELASEGVLPVLVKVENTGTERYVAKKIDMKAYLAGQPLVPLDPRDAARQAATSEYAGKALGWTLAAGPFAILLWPVTIGASAVHTRQVNRRIEAYFEAASYQDALLAAKQTAVGFVYFKLPDGAKTLEQLTLEIDVAKEADGKKLSYKFDLPPLVASK